MKYVALVCMLALTPADRGYKQPEWEVYDHVVFRTVKVTRLGQNFAANNKTQWEEKHILLLRERGVSRRLELEAKYQVDEFPEPYRHKDTTRSRFHCAVPKHESSDYFYGWVPSVFTDLRVETKAITWQELKEDRSE